MGAGKEIGMNAEEKRGPHEYFCREGIKHIDTKMHIEPCPMVCAVCVPSRGEQLGNGDRDPSTDTSFSLDRDGTQEFAMPKKPNHTSHLWIVEQLRKQKRSMNIGLMGMTKKKEQ